MLFEHSGLPAVFDFEVVDPYDHPIVYHAEFENDSDGIKITWNYENKDGSTYYSVKTIKELIDDHRWIVLSNCVDEDDDFAPELDSIL